VGWVALEPKAPSTVPAPANAGLDIDRIAREEGADPVMVRAVMGAESSGGRDTSTSPDGARGSMQIIPDTFKRFAKPGEVIDNPEHNLRAGARYLKFLGERVGNDPFRVGAAYLSGEGNVTPDGIKNDNVKDSLGTRPSQHGENIARRYQELSGRVPPPVATKGGWVPLDAASGMAQTQPAGADPFESMLGYLDKTPPAPAAAKPPTRNAFAYANDTMINAANTVVGLAKTLPDLIDPTNPISAALDSFIKSGEASQSDWQKAQNAKLAADVQAAEGEGGKFWAYFKHAVVNDPIKLLAEAGGNIGPFALIGKGLQAANLTKGAATVAVSSIAGAMGAGEVRGNIYQKIQSIPDAELQAVNPEYAQMRQSMTEAQAKADFGSRFVEHLPELAVTAIIGALGGKYGLEGLAAGTGVKVGRTAGAAIGAVDEGLVQGGGEQIATNVGVRRVDPRQSLTEGVGQNIAAEGLPGFVGGALSGGSRAEPAAPPAAPTKGGWVPLEPEVKPEAAATGPVPPTTGPATTGPTAADILGPDPTTTETAAPPAQQVDPTRSSSAARAQTAPDVAPEAQDLLATETTPPAEPPAPPDGGAPAPRQYPKTDDEGRRYRPFVSGAVVDAGETITGAYPDRIYAPEPTAIAAAPTATAVTPEPEPAPTAVPTVEARAHLAATSPANDTPEPTEAQKKAGNYKMGRARVAGLDISIENPRGSVRSGTSPDGKAWESILHSHYGYVRGTTGADGDHVDVFLKPDTQENWTGEVYIVDQVDPKTGAWDEHKVLIGYDSIDEARDAYHANYQKGWKGLKAISAVPMDGLKTWLQGDTTTPFDKSVPAVSPAKEGADKPAPKKAKPAAAERSDDTEQSSEQSDLSRARRNRRGLVAHDDVEALVARVRQKLPGLPEVVIVENLDDRRVPRSLAREAEAVGGIEGAYHTDGKIYLVRDAIPTIDAAEGVLAHETLHAALTTVFADEKRALMLSIRDGNPMVRKAAAAFLQKYPGESEGVAIEEVLADYARAGKHPTVVQRFTNWIRSVLRKLGFSRIASSWTDGEIMALVADAPRVFKAANPRLRLYGDSRFSATAPIFFSKMAEFIAKKGSAGSPAEWKMRLKAWATKGEFKADELQWSGLMEWLDTRTGKVTPDDVLGYLREGGVKVEEVMLGGDVFPLPDGWVIESTEDGYAVLDEDGEIRGEGATAREAQDDAVDPDERVGAADAKFASYQLPGGENYRELLLTLPTKNRGMSQSEIDALDKRIVAAGFGGLASDQREALARSGNDAIEGLDDIEERVGVNTADFRAAMTGGNSDGQFRSSHFDQPNIIAHVRFNDRAAARPGVDLNEIGERIRQAIGAKSQNSLGNGAPEAAVRKGAITAQEARWYSHHRGFVNVPTENPALRVLFLEEVQSDWGQAGKKQGFRKPEQTPWQVFVSKGYGVADQGGYWQVLDYNGDPVAEGNTRDEAIQDLVTRDAEASPGGPPINEAGVPAAPFVTKTEAWTALALKRMLRYAAENGYDAIAWTTGEQQAERYSLDKKIGSVTYVPGVNGGTLLATDLGGNSFVMKETGIKPEQIADHVGKEVAEKLLAQPLREGSHKLSGDGLRVPQTGMRAFYDKIIPNVANGIVKGMGAKVETVNLADAGGGWTVEFEDGSRANESMTEREAREKEADDGGGAKAVRVSSLTQPGIMLTDAMRETAMRGLPLFSRKKFGPQQEGMTVPADVLETASVESSFTFAASRQFRTNREFKVAMQDRLREKLHGLDLADRSAASERYLVAATIQDALTALRSNANAVGWYDEKVTKAIEVLSLLHPELKTNAQARFAFTWALAATSNGLKVDKNFELAETAYQQFKKTGKMPTNIGIGTAKSAINKGLRLYNTTVKRMGQKRAREFMTTLAPKSQIARETGMEIAGEYADTVVYGAAILGPKIGNGFFMNLYGRFEQLTMDRWLMRTWGRWTATLINVKPEAVVKKREQMMGLLKLMSAEQRAAFSDLIKSPLVVTTPAEAKAVADAIKKASASGETREAMAEIGILGEAGLAQVEELMGPPRADQARISFGDELRKVGNNLWKEIDGQKEAPQDGGERNFIRSVFGKALASLQEQHPALTMADLQALLWYPEKRLYDASKSEDESDEGYNEDEAPDYANAAAKLARDNGVSNEQIAKAIRAVDRRIARARAAGDGAGPAGRGDRGVFQEAGPGGSGAGAETRLSRLGQARLDQTDTNAFQRWSEGAPLIPADFADTYDGGPAVFESFHGTTHAGITVVNPRPKQGNAEGYLGAGFYTTTSRVDASENYAGMGPDLTSRVERKTEEIGQGWEDDAYVRNELLQDYLNESPEAVGRLADRLDIPADEFDFEALTEDQLDTAADLLGNDAISFAAKAAVAGDTAGLVMPVFVKMLKPFDIRPGGLDLTIEYDTDEEGDIVDGSEKGLALDFIQALQGVADAYGIDTSDLTAYIYENALDGVSAHDIFQRAAKDLNEVYDDNGEMLSAGAIMQEAARDAGYDGFVMDADLAFGTQKRGFGGARVPGMKGVEPGTLHLMPFSAEQVKSATGNSGEFDGSKPSILEDRSRIKGMYNIDAVVPPKQLTAAFRRWDAGEVSDAWMLVRLREEMGRREERRNAAPADRVRGADWIQERLTRARRTGELSAQEVEVALWMVQQNPQLANDLGIGIREGSEDSPSGDYSTLGRVMRLFTSHANEDTAAHELLHHTERMMPPEVQAGIRREWLKQTRKAVEKAKAKLDNQGDPQAEARLRFLLDRFMEALNQGNDVFAMQIWRGIGRDTLRNILPYQYSAASEFWAVNGASLMRRRFESQGSWMARAHQWLREFIAKVKSAFGLASDAPILRGLQAVMDGDGTFRARSMISNLEGFNDLTGTDAFRKWFGKSVVVDAKGAPLVVYHGSSDARFMKSDGIFKNIHEQHGMVNSDRAFWFAKDRATAASYADDRRAFDYQGADAGVIPAYLKLENPLIVDGAGKQWRDAQMRGQTSDVIEEAKRGGHDGVIIRNVRDDYTGFGKGKESRATDTYVVFSSNQIKSATQNSGTFDPDNPDIRLSRAGQATNSTTAPASQGRVVSGAAPTSWTVDEPSRLDNLIYTMQDKFIDTKRVLQAITAFSGQVADWVNPYLSEELYHGRAAKRVEEFTSGELKPLLQEMRDKGVTIPEFEQFLHARHAKERNDQIARINPQMPDGGSGMLTADARSHLASIPASKRAVLNALALKVDAITAETRATLIGYGLESADTMAAWEGAYQHYVPLMREDMETGFGNGTGAGFSIRGSASKRATGSDLKVANILGNLALQRERAIVRGEKNRIATALWGLAKLNPNPSFWKVDTPPKVKSVSKTTGLVEERDDPDYKSQDNVIVARIPDPQTGEIHERAIIFNGRDERAKRMAAAIKNLDADSLGTILKWSAIVTRWFSAVNTQYNPIFGIVNLMRDVQSAAVNLTSTALAGRQAEVMQGTLSAMRGIYRTERGKPSAWQTLWEEFQKEGGQTGYRDMFATGEDRAKGIERELKAMARGKPMKGAAAFFQWLSDYNTAIENSTRLSAYKAALNAGMTKPQAASLAKNLTVNFNRKGQIASQAGAMYAFFNASMQGTARLAETLSGPKGRKIVAGGIALGVMQAAVLAMAGFDDDEPPEFVRERNLVVPIGGGKYVALPMPLGLHVLPNIGRMATEYALSGGKETQKRVIDVFALLVEAFNPIGTSGLSMQTLTPTAVDPLAALAENRDWTGKPIYREDFNKLAPTPGFTRTKDTATEMSKALARTLNIMSGGSEYRPGQINLTPDQIDYLVGQATGGVGREALKIEQTVGSLVTGEELPTHKVPLFGRLYGSVDGNTSQASRFYDNVTKMSGHEAEIRGRSLHKQDTSEYLEDNPEAKLWPQAKAYAEMVAKLRQQKRMLMERDAPREEIKRIEDQITGRMKAFNDSVKAAKK